MEAKVVNVKPVDAIFIVIPTILTLTYWLATFSG